MPGGAPARLQIWLRYGWLSMLLSGEREQAGHLWEVTELGLSHQGLGNSPYPRCRSEASQFPVSGGARTRSVPAFLPSFLLFGLPAIAHTSLDWILAHSDLGELDSGWVWGRLLVWKPETLDRRLRRPDAVYLLCFPLKERP